MKSIYLEETKELLEGIESSLLLLEAAPNDGSLIEEIFRVMHTVKGSSGMFGFENVASFVHHLESIYDQIREGKMSVTKELLDITLQAIDHLQKIIYDVDLEQKENKDSHELLTAKILSLISSYDLKTDQEAKGSTDFSEKEESLSTYYILFQPDESLFSNGTNPLFILDELFSLGKCEVFPRFKELNSIDEYDPVKCFSYWEVLLSTNTSVDGLWDVFLFVENDGKLKIEKICDFDFLSTDNIKPLLLNFSEARSEFINLEELAEVVNKAKEELLLKGKEQTSDNLEVTDVEVNVTEGSQKGKSQEKVVSSIRVTSDKLDTLMSIVSELVTTQASLSLYSENHHSSEIETISENIEKLSRQLRDVTFAITLIPISSIMGRFQRLVRDISSDLGKNIEFKVEGDETELDKNIIESLTAPLMHILRNSLDHGIESKEVRKQKGKPEVGTILFKAFYSGANVFIEIKDDGRGIDIEAVKEKAIAKGIISKDDNLTDKEAHDLIFYPSFSTAKEVTDVSGRGVGMDVVKRNVTDLRGDIFIDSELDKGTIISIKLPLTLSIIDGLLVNINEDNFLVPLSVISKCYEIPFEKLNDNFHRLLVLDGVQVPFLNLREELDLGGQQPETVQIIVVKNGEKRVAISVDEIIGEYQAVLKPIGKHYKDQDFISGATILGDGNIALVFDTNRMIDQFQMA